MIILAHEKSFEADNYSLLKSIFLSAQQADTTVILYLLSSTTHHALMSSRTQFIEPLVHELYALTPTDSLFGLGCVWLRIGGLRYRLLQCCDDVDPAVKKDFKYSQLSDRIALLELDIEVRQECVYLAGSFSLSESDKEKTKLLNELKNEKKHSPETGAKLGEQVRGIDSIMSARTSNEHDASRRLKSEFLVQFDDVSSNSNDLVIVIGATNKPQELDDAVIRRLVKRIYITLPDANVRRSLFKHKLMGHFSSSNRYGTNTF